jgi:hypothetical protein
MIMIAVVFVTAVIITNPNLCWGCIVILAKSLYLSVFVFLFLLSDFSPTRPHISISFCRHLENFLVRIEFAFKYYWTSFIEIPWFLEL